MGDVHTEQVVRQVLIQECLFRRPIVITVAEYFRHPPQAGQRVLVVGSSEPVESGRLLGTGFILGPTPYDIAWPRGDREEQPHAATRCLLPRQPQGVVKTRP